MRVFSVFCHLLWFAKIFGMLFFYSLQINVPIQLNIASKYCVDELYYVVSVLPDIILPKVVICFSQLNICQF